MTESNAKEEDPRIPESLKRLKEEARRKWTPEVGSPPPLPILCNNASRTKLSMNPLKLFSNSKSDLAVYVGLVENADESDKDTDKCIRNGCDVESDDECTACLGTTQSSRRGLERQASERRRIKAEQDSSRTDITVGRARREIGRSASARKLVSTRSGSAKDLFKRDLNRPLPPRSMSSRDLTRGDSCSKGGRSLTSGRHSSNRRSLDLGGSASSLNLDGRSSSLPKRKGSSKGPRKARVSRNSPQRTSRSEDPKKRVGISPEAAKCCGDKAASCHANDNHAVSVLLKKEGSSRRLQASGPQGGRRSPPRKSRSTSSSKEPRKRDSTSPNVEKSTVDAADSLHNFARQKKKYSQRLDRALSTKAILDEAQKKKRKKRIVRRNKSADYALLQDPQEATKVNATWTANTQETSKACRPGLMDPRLKSAFKRIIKAKKDALDVAAIEHGPSQTICAETSAKESPPNEEAGFEESSSKNIKTSRGAAGTAVEINSKEDAADSDASQTSALPSKVEVITPLIEHSIRRSEVDALNDDDTVILTPEELKYWRCKCGEPNENLFKFCGMCREAKNWSCALCKFEHNKCKFLYCGSCSTPKVVLNAGSSCPKILPSQDSWSSINSSAA